MSSRHFYIATNRLIDSWFKCERSPTSLSRTNTVSISSAVTRCQSAARKVVLSDDGRPIMV